MGNSFNAGWEFQLEGEAGWHKVELPHDWLIADTRDLYATGVGKYRKYHFFTPQEAEGRVWLRFDGVYMDSVLWVNGECAGEWKNGYTAFSHEITQFLHEGENLIEVTVNHQSPNSRWYSGAGIYRDCWLIVKRGVCFAQDGIYITTTREGGEGAWRLDIEAVIEGIESSPAAKKITVKHRINGIPESKIECCDGNITHAQIQVHNPKLWDTWDSPGFSGEAKCYTLVSELYAEGTLVDTVRTRFGFREISFSPKGGFLLNGRRVQLNGVCQHHDLGGLGAAMNKDALRRQLEILRDMGVNAIRTAHNPPAAAFMELTDEMGFVVQSEFSDVWKRRKTTYDYARFFEEWAACDVAAWVRRDRNCPSIVMWSLGNEIYDTHADFEDGSATMKFLTEEVKKHDRHGHAPVTLCSNYMPWENTQKCADIIKLIGYNYAEYLYHKHRAEHPDWIIYGGETASTVQSRGVYHFPLSKPLLSDDDLQCSALGNSTTSWGAKSPEACIIDHRDAPFSLGQFLWTGTDYIGEPTPYHTKNSYFGQVDTAGFPKDSFYIYQSAWVPFEKKCVLHLFPHWDWNEGQPVDVRIASNAPRVELFVNGKSWGVKEIDHARGVKRENAPPDAVKLVADYIVPYEPGEIRAVAYDAAGNIVKEVMRRSFGDAAALRMEHKTYGALTFTQITAVDGAGNIVENANTRVRVTAVRGKLLALDNGDSTDYDQYQSVDGVSHTRRMFGGKLLAITKNTGRTPEITAEINPAYIPVRKIEIIQGETTPEGAFTFSAKIHPSNASDDTICWRLTDASGIDSPLGKIIPREPEIVAHDTTVPSQSSFMTFSFVPKGDGEVFVRAAAMNGKDHPDIISLLSVTLSGYGKPFLDPYSFLSGGLYNRSNVPLGNGNERGVATERDGESHIGFADVDFGAYGSDTVTLWLFPLDGSPFDFEIWSGMPNDMTSHNSGSRLIYTAHYDKGSQWNTYKEVTYTLPERLTSVQTLCFVFNRKVHIKGFQFAPPTRAHQKISFAAHDGIYGDSYEITADTVEKIGNNVTISFAGMDFSAGEAGVVEIAWRAAQGNTIRMVFTPDTQGGIINLLTLPAQEEYAPARLTLNTPLTGRGTLEFIFLPGTEIDLAWYKLT